MERIHHVIGNIFITQNLDNQVFDLIDPLGPTLSLTIRESHHSTLGYTPCQTVFQRDMIFNLKTIVHWKVLNAQIRYPQRIGIPAPARYATAIFPPI